MRLANDELEELRDELYDNLQRIAKPRGYEISDLKLAGNIYDQPLNYTKAEVIFYVYAPTILDPDFPTRIVISDLRWLNIATFNEVFAFLFDECEQRIERLGLKTSKDEVLPE